MDIPSQKEIEALQNEAQQNMRDGDLYSATQKQTLVVEQLLGLGPKTLSAQGLVDSLENASSRLVDMLRWAGNYPAAVALQKRLIEYLPALEDALQLGAANLCVESEDMQETGLQTLRDLAASAPENYWYRISLACGLMCLEQFEEAELVLREAADMTHVRKVDRAMAHERLFGLYERQGKTDQALLAWREAYRLDQSLRHEMLPDVCRMLIYWRKLDDARKHIAMDTNQVRRQFFLGLAAYTEEKQDEALKIWQNVMLNFNPAALKDGQDEYAETCLRLANPGGAITILEKLLEEGQGSYYRSVILGLAYAQRGLLNRVRFHLDIAVRLGDMERPRLTLPSEEKRALGMNAAILFTGTPLDPTVRKQIDAYFIPRV